MSALRILHVAPYFENAWAYGGIPRVVSAQVHALGRGGASGHRGHQRRARRGWPDRHRGRPSLVALRPSRRTHRRRHRGAGLPNISNAIAYRWQFYVPLRVRARPPHQRPPVRRGSPARVSQPADASARSTSAVRVCRTSCSRTGRPGASRGGWRRSGSSMPCSGAACCRTPAASSPSPSGNGASSKATPGATARRG